MTWNPPQASLSRFFKETLESIPEVQALGTKQVWAIQAPSDIEGVVVTYGQIGPGRGITPIGARGPVAANYRFQWRVGYRGEGFGPLVEVAGAIHEKLSSFDEVTLPDGKTASFTTDVTDTPPQPVDDSGRPMQELGGEVMIFVDFGVSP